MYARNPGIKKNPTNTSRGFHLETTWKRSFPRRFKVEYTCCVCREYIAFIQPVG